MKTDYFNNIANVLLDNETYVNILKKYTDTIGWKAIYKLSDLLESNLYYGIDPPEDFSYENHEWNMTNAFGTFKNIYGTHGSDFLTKLLTTPIFSNWS